MLLYDLPQELVSVAQLRETGHQLEPLFAERPQSREPRGDGRVWLGRARFGRG
jgi:hypothetical protein